MYVVYMPHNTVCMYTVTSDKTEGSAGQVEGKDGGQLGGGGGVKRPGQFSGEKMPDAKRTRT